MDADASTHKRILNHGVLLRRKNLHDHTAVQTSFSKIKNLWLTSFFFKILYGDKNNTFSKVSTHKSIRRLGFLVFQWKTGKQDPIAIAAPVAWTSAQNKINQ